MALQHEADYRAWLSKKFSGPQLSDQVSRTKRVLRSTDVARCRDLAELEVALRRDEALEQCTVSVRSQLKRAARMYYQFLEHKVAN